MADESDMSDSAALVCIPESKQSEPARETITFNTSYTTLHWRFSTKLFDHQESAV
jgi:hypothetical protein